MKKSYIKRLLTQPRAKFTPKLPIIPEEGSDKNFLIKQLEATERLMKCYTTTGKHPLFILLIPAFSITSSNSLTNTLPKSSMTGTSTKDMPRSYQHETPNVPHHSVSSSSARYSPSYHYTGQYITPESFADTIAQRDHLASAVTLLQGNPVFFAEFVFLDYLCCDL